MPDPPAAGYEASLRGRPARPLLPAVSTGERVRFIRLGFRAGRAPVSRSVRVARYDLRYRSSTAPASALPARTRASSSRAFSTSILTCSLSRALASRGRCCARTPAMHTSAVIPMSGSRHDDRSIPQLQTIPAGQSRSRVQGIMQIQRGCLFSVASTQLLVAHFSSQSRELG